MKTKFFTLIVMAIGILASTSAFAQPTERNSISSVTAKDGSTINYSVTAATGSTYHWTLSGGSTTNDVPATGTVDDNSVSITWDNATAGETYNLDVYIEDTNGCYSELYSYAITIESVVLSITDETATTCSWLGGTDADVSGNTVSANDQFSFPLTTDADGATNPITVSYNVTGGTVADSRTYDATFTSNSSMLIVDIDDYFDNTTGANVTYTITLTSAVDDDGNTVDIGSAKTATILVHPTPVITLN